MSFTDDLPEAPALEAEVIPIRPEVTALMRRDPKEMEKVQEQLKSVEDELFRNAAEIAVDALHFRELSPDMEQPPEAWVRELGMEGAMKRFRTAQAAWMAASEAPVGLNMATRVTLGMIKAKSVERAGRTNLNVAIITVGAQKDYGEPIDVTGD